MLTRPGIKPTEEGEAILKNVREDNDNILVEAYAGAGKTTMAEFIVETLPKDEPSLYLVFGKQDQLNAEGRLPSRCKCVTMNGMGHRICASNFGKISLDTMKVRNILKQQISELKGEDRETAAEEYWDISAAIGMARHIGYIPDGKFPDARRLTDREGLAARTETKLSEVGWYLVDNVLLTTIKAAYAGSIDFDDQVYMSALFCNTFPRFPNVLVDEWQDQSPAGNALLERLTKESRVFGVGDRWQSIYHFRGAETGGMDKAKGKYNMKEFPLSVSFRCPSAIVQAARWRVPNLKWFREGGHYEVLNKLAGATIPDDAAIICRNNAPLLRMAFSLLSEKRSVQVMGSDIGPKIVTLLNKIGSPRDTQEDMMFKIDAWRDEKLARTNAPATVIDTAECLKVFVTWGKDVQQAMDYANYIFKQQGKITLTTGHKAKGKEWENVYHLDPQLLRDDDQDLNLKYVITTRAKERLYEIRSEEIAW